MDNPEGFVPGADVPNSIYASVGRRLIGESVYQEPEILCDIARGLGGITAVSDLDENDWQVVFFKH